MPKVTRETALLIISDMVFRYIQSHGKPPNTIIAVGGTAMSLRGLRDESEDLDIFYPDAAFLSIARDLEAQSGFAIDVTSKNNLWGQIRVQDIEQDAEVLESLEIEGFTVDVAAISSETLFVIKSCSMRNKDRIDLPLLARATTPQDIISRAEFLLKTVETDANKEEMLANLLSEMQLAYLEPVNFEWFARSPEFVQEYSELINDQFQYTFTSKKQPTHPTTHPHIRRPKRP